MSKETINKKEYEVIKCSFGKFMEIRHECTEILKDMPIYNEKGEETGKFHKDTNNVKLGRKLIQTLVKLDGKPVDINNEEQCGFEDGAALFEWITEHIDKLSGTETKNSLSEQEKV